MAKRANPFIEDFVPQSKTHVGIKQFNNNEERLKKVYEKTLELLFRGAKKVPAQEVINTSEIDQDAEDTNKKDKMKQLFIDKNGKLLHSGNVIASKLVVKGCACGSSAESQCGYCEVSLCVSCQHLCDRCKHFYCSHCTLVRLEGKEVCVSCYD